MMELDQDLLAALRLAASDPTRMLQRVGSWPPSSYRPPAPATPEQVQASERRLGFSLPMVVRQVFTLVANGGFGPGYGLLGLEGGAANDLGGTAVDNYLMRRSWNGQRGYYWPEHLLPICHWGCAIFACVNCEQGGGLRVVRYDPGWDDGWMRFRDEGRGFAEWLRGWLDGEDLWELPEPDADEETAIRRSLEEHPGQLRLFR
jgi:hypothetical protein